MKDIWMANISIINYQISSSLQECLYYLQKSNNNLRPSKNFTNVSTPSIIYRLQMNIMITRRDKRLIFATINYEIPPYSINPLPPYFIFFFSTLSQPCTNPHPLNRNSFFLCINYIFPIQFLNPLSSPTHHTT